MEETGACSGRTMLLVDDHPSIRLILASGLRARGWTVLTAGNGTEALDLCRSHEGEIDLLLTDLGLVPEELWRRGGDVRGVANGLELMRQVTAIRPSIKAVVISGYSDDRLAQLGVDRAHCRVVRKPFDLTMLLQHVSDALSAAPSMRN